MLLSALILDELPSVDELPPSVDDSVEVSELDESVDDSEVEDISVVSIHMASITLKLISF